MEKYIDSFKDEEQIPYSLPYFQASMFATVLEDTMLELQILCECNNELRVTKTMADISLLRALKYDVEQPPIEEELDAIDPHKLGCMEYKLNKLFADRKYFGDVLKSTYLDLILKKSYKSLAEHVQVVIDRNNHRDLLLEDEAKNRTLRRELNRQYRTQRNHTKSVMYDTDVTIAQLRNDVEDAALNADIQGRYVKNWQQARTEQHWQDINMKEAVPLQTIENYKQRSDHEQRVHTEIEMLISIAINETLQEAETWMAKYDKDMEAIDLKIQIMKNNHAVTYEKRVELEETFAEHDKLIKSWVDFKNKREEARLYREKMTQAAITVQAWWRGLLVRNQLGPYKPAPKKKKAGGNEKKK